MDDQNDEDAALEERADHLTAQAIADNTAIDGPTSNILSKLLEPGAKLIVGPRGCGKTHLMRYALVTSLAPTQPFCMYVSFNRYYRLEPLLRTKSNALDLFHGWVLCLCYLGLYEAVAACKQANITNESSDELWIEYPDTELKAIIGRLERGGSLTQPLQDTFDTLSIDGLKVSLERITRKLGKKVCRLVRRCGTNVNSRVSSRFF